MRPKSFVESSVKCKRFTGARQAAVGGQGGACRAATSPPASSGRLELEKISGPFVAPLNAALLVAARRVPPPGALSTIRFRRTRRGSKRKITIESATHPLTYLRQRKCSREKPKVKPTDLRGILQYIPRFREKIFVLSLDGAIVTEENFSASSFVMGPQRKSASSPSNRRSKRRTPMARASPTRRR